MENALLPILLFIAVSAALAVGMLVTGSLIGPRRQGDVGGGGDGHRQRSASRRRRL